MTGLDLLLLALAGAAALLLLAAGVGHLRHRRMLAATLDAQGLLAYRLRPLVVAVLGPVEVVLGAGLLVALAVGGGRAVALAVGLLYLLFAVQLVAVLRLRPGAPCGCFGSSAPASAGSVARAAVLALTCLVVAVRGTGSGGPGDLLVAAGAAVVVAAALWVLPLLTTSTEG